MTPQPYDNLILVSGMPRSGTTWIGKIFDSHPDTIYLHEPDSHDKIKIPLAADCRQLDHYREVMRHWVDSLKNNTAVEVRGKLPLFSKRYLSGISTFIFNRNVEIAKIGQRFSLRFPIINVWKKSSGHGITVWKSIQSTGRVGVLARGLDGIKIVQIIRHPAGHVASILRGRAMNKFDSSVDDDNVLKQLLATEQARRRPERLADLRRMSLEERQAWRWAVFNDKAIEELEGIADAMIIRYEDICRHPVREAKKIFAFTGLPWDVQTEEFLGYSTGENREGYYSVRKKSIEVAQRWQRELTPAQVSRIMAMVAESRAGKLYREEKT